MTGSRPPIGRLSPDNWASHGAGRHWLRGHTPHFLHEKCAVSTESQLLKIVRRPEQRHQSKQCQNEGFEWNHGGVRAKKTLLFHVFISRYFHLLKPFSLPSTISPPQACLPSHGCDTAVGVRSADAIQLGALALLLKATGRDLIPWCG